MPPMNIYGCNSCKLLLDKGWGGYQYVEDDNGKIIECPHPMEDSTIAEILKLERGEVSRFEVPSWWWSRKRRARYVSIKTLVEKRTGYNSTCLCFKCKKICYLDIGDAETAENSWRYQLYDATKQKDKRQCPKCGAIEIETVFELIGKTCPICNEGKIIEIETGAYA